MSTWEAIGSRAGFHLGKGSELVELPNVDIGFKNLDYD